MPFSRTHSWQATVSDIPGEHELQTDIMRFLAILALCLMAVFALVQSIPQPAPPAEEQEPIAPDPRPLLERQITNLQQQLAQLSIEQRVAENTLEALNIEQQTAHVELTQVTEQLIERRQKLTTSTTRLADITQALNTKQTELETLNGRKKTEKQRLQQIEMRVSQLRQKAREQQPAEPRQPAAPLPPLRAAAQPAAPPAPQAEPPVNPEAEGFSLRFASEPALRSLVAMGRIAFFAKQGKDFLQLSLKGARGLFKPATAPSAYYEMTPSTVPSGFKQALVRSTGHAVSPQAVWGVTLPGGIARRVQQLMQANKGGTLVIQADGQVVLERRRHS